MTSEGEDRITALGRLTTAYTIGALLCRKTSLPPTLTLAVLIVAGGIGGPYLGGILGAKGDYSAGDTKRLIRIQNTHRLLLPGAQYATAGCLFAAMLVMLLPAKLDNAQSKAADLKAQEAEMEADSKRSWGSKAGKILGLVGLYLFVKIGTGVANSMARSAQPVIFKNKFGFDEVLSRQPNQPNQPNHTHSILAATWRRRFESEFRKSSGTPSHPRSR